jgi:hypothetical protein
MQGQDGVAGIVFFTEQPFEFHSLDGCSQLIEELFGLVRSFAVAFCRELRVKTGVFELLPELFPSAQGPLDLSTFL